jgi:ubiquinone/menaquinone biosynthesis C-methylase UbiE
MDDNKSIYETNYSRANFSLGGDRYTRAMQAIRFDLIERYGRDRDVLDVGCATGDYLKATCGRFKSATGLDYTQRFLDEFAQSLGDDKPANLRLVCADARDMPFPPASFDLAYSFATLYSIPEAEQVVSELGRVVRPGGTVVLEFGNLMSLNTLVAESWHKAEGWAKPYHVRLSDIRRWLADAGFVIEHWRSFQILPLYAIPRRLMWLRPLSGQPLRPLLGRRLASGRMVDEIVSGLPLLRSFAFRQLVVARRSRELATGA